MPLWLQHVLVLSIVAVCAAWVLFQSLNVFNRSSKLGRCCAKGCGEALPQSQKKTAERIIFLPAESLRRR